MTSTVESTNIKEETSFTSTLTMEISLLPDGSVSSTFALSTSKTSEFMTSPDTSTRIMKETTPEEFITSTLTNELTKTTIGSTQIFLYYSTPQSPLTSESTYEFLTDELTSNNEATTPITSFTNTITNEISETTGLSKTEPSSQSSTTSASSESTSGGQITRTIQLFSTGYSSIFTSLQQSTSELPSTFIEIDTTSANDDTTDSTHVNYFITSETRPITTKDLTSTEILISEATTTKLSTLEHSIEPTEINSFSTKESTVPIIEVSTHQPIIVSTTYSVTKLPTSELTFTGYLINSFFFLSFYLVIQLIYLY